MNENESNILAQWQVCVEMANSVSQRRDTMNNLFVTLNVAIIAATSIVWDMKSIVVAVGGMAVCVVWLMMVKNFKLLNEAKFAVILDLESKLPEHPFSDEWEKLKSKKGYKDGTRLEYTLPLAFIVIYVVLIFTIVIIKIQGGKVE